MKPNLKGPSQSKCTPNDLNGIQSLNATRTRDRIQWSQPLNEWMNVCIYYCCWVVTKREKNIFLGLGLGLLLGLGLWQEQEGTLRTTWDVKNFGKEAGILTTSWMLTVNWIKLEPTKKETKRPKRLLFWMILYFTLIDSIHNRKSSMGDNLIHWNSILPNWDLFDKLYF